MYLVNLPFHVLALKCNMQKLLLVQGICVTTWFPNVSRSNQVIATSVSLMIGDASI